MHPKSCRIYTSAASGVLYRDDSEKQSGVYDPEFRALPPVIQEESAVTNSIRRLSTSGVCSVSGIS
jgi:hypothetical protein